MGRTASDRGDDRAPPLRLSITPDSVSVTVGDQARYDVALLRGSERGPVTFTATDLPAGATAEFAPATTDGAATVLTIRTDGDATDGSVTPAGDYRVVVRATGDDAAVGATVALKVQNGTFIGTDNGVRAEGSLVTPLSPGSSGPLDVALTNPNPETVTLTGLTIGLDSVSAPNAAAARPCIVADFAVGPYTGPGLQLAAGATATLSQLGVAATDWPTVSMRNTASNQDDCQRAVLRFTLVLTGQTA